MRVKEDRDFFAKENPELRVRINIGIDSKNRKVAVNTLSTLLASTQILAIKTFSFHWNMRGKLSAFLRAVTKDQYDELVSGMNNIAERIRTLGYNVPDTYSHIMKLSDVDHVNYDQISMLTELIRDNENLAKYIRKEKDVIDETNDQVTVDLLMKRLKVHEKNAWAFRNLLER